MLSACSNNPTTFCSKRQPFTGTTYGDLIEYTGDLERVYDACSN